MKRLQSLLKCLGFYKIHSGGCQGNGVAGNVTEVIM